MNKIWSMFWIVFVVFVLGVAVLGGFMVFDIFRGADEAYYKNDRYIDLTFKGGEAIEWQFKDGQGRVYFESLINHSDGDFEPEFIAECNGQELTLFNISPPDTPLSYEGDIMYYGLIVDSGNSSCSMLEGNARVRIFDQDGKGVEVIHYPSTSGVLLSIFGGLFVSGMIAAILYLLFRLLRGESKKRREESGK